MKYDLTNNEANLLKDILKIVGRDDGLTLDLAEGLGMSADAFNDISDVIYSKLGNGRILTE